MATQTILFTDAVASTQALSRLGDERFAVVQETHLDLLREAIAAHDGREVKSLGDGLMVAFSGAMEALGCAVAMQQAIDRAARRGEESLPLRVGISCGDVSVGDDGDVRGTAVVEAARLCDAAVGGQILANDLVRALAGSRGGHVFTSLGGVELKGLPDPLPVVEVGWAPLAEHGGVAPVPLPPRLAAEVSPAFVGRTAEVERLLEIWREVAGGVRVALLGGEPGAGKTTLAREMAVRAHDEGALVLFGRVDEDLAVAYRPFAEALRHYLTSVDEVTRSRVLALRGGVLTRLVPELVDEPVQGQIESWTLFEALVDWLAEEATRRSAVLVLDDLHWAARPTLMATMHLVRSERLSRLLIIATYRDTEVDRRHPLAEMLADLHRVDGVERIPVRGLDADGVAAFVQAAGGDDLDEHAREFAAHLAEQTQGNPFFVGQVLRHRAETGAGGEFVVPEGIRDVVGRRISRLSERAGQLLTVAAVAGPEFDTAIVADVAAQPTVQALDGFDEALAARLVLETDTPGRLRFTHALVRQTLEDELSTMRRLHLHQQLGLELERRFGEADTAVAERAHHFTEAAPLGEGARAARYAERAAVQALDRAAPDQAADLLDHALDVLPPESDPDGRDRNRLYELRAHCCLTIWDMDRMPAVCARWFAHGRDCDDAIAQIRSASFWLYAFVARPPDPEAAAAFASTLLVDVDTLDFRGRRCISSLGTWQDLDAAGLRAWQLSLTAQMWALELPLETISPQLAHSSPMELADHALEQMERSQVPDEAELWWGRAWVLAADPDAEAQLDASRRALRLGLTRNGGGAAQRGVALARLGRLDEVRESAEEMLRTAQRTRDLLGTAQAHWLLAMEALTRGRHDEAGSANQQALAVRPDDVAIQLACGFLEVGRLLAAGHADQARPIADLLDASPAFDASHLVGAVAAAQGDLATVRAVLDAWRERGHLPPANWARSARLWGLAECAHAAGDRIAAKRLYDALLPYDGQLLVFLTSLIPASAAFTLGLLADTLDDRGQAGAHFAAALEFEDRIGAVTLATRTRAAATRLDGRFARRPKVTD